MAASDSVETVERSNFVSLQRPHESTAATVDHPLEPSSSVGHPPLNVARVHMYFFFFGTAALLPWNCMLNVMSFMDIQAFPGHHWALLTTPFYNGSGLATQVLMLFVGQFLTTWKVIFFSLPLGAACCAVVVVTLFPVFPTDTRFLLAFMSVIGVGISMSGLLNTSAGELCGKLTEEYGPLAAHYSNGLAAAGVISLVTADVLSAVKSQDLAAKGLFVLTAVILIGCLLALADLVRSGTLSPAREPSFSISTEPSTEITLDPFDVTATPVLCPSGPGSAGARTPLTYSSPSSTASGSATRVPLHSGPTSRSPSPSPPSSPPMTRRESVARVGGGLARGWQQEVNLMFIYIQTFIAFPEVCLKWVPQDAWTSQESYGLIMVSIFQVFDLLGRLLCTAPGMIRCFPAGNKLWIPVALRTLLLPFFFMGWRSPASVFGSFSCQAALLALFACSNGALTNLCFTAGCSEAAVADRDVAGRALPLCLSVGIVLGSIVSSTSISVVEAWT